jgi:hypothetical protein
VDHACIVLNITRVVAAVGWAGFGDIYYFLMPRKRKKLIIIFSLYACQLYSHMLIVLRDQVRNRCAWMSQLRSVTLIQMGQNSLISAPHLLYKYSLQFFHLFFAPDLTIRNHSLFSFSHNFSSSQITLLYHFRVVVCHIELIYEYQYHNRSSKDRWCNYDRSL